MKISSSSPFDQGAVLDAEVRLDEMRLLADVRTRTGLSELHEHDLGDRLRKLLAHFNDDLGLADDGRRAAYEAVLDLVINRSQLLADRERYPGITTSLIERPIMVTGLPRSGTTLLHSLLAADPGNRAPEWWESLRPSPPPGVSAADDPRLERAHQDLAALIELQPALLRSHPYFDEGGHALMECEALGVTDLRHILRSVFYKVPAVPTIALNTDPVGFYRYHKKVLQALQWSRPPRRWALKGTEHHVRLEALKSVYPDAIVIWVHRDPQRVFPSIMELLTGLYEGIAGSIIDKPAFGRAVLSKYLSMLESAMQSPLIDHPDVFHLRYHAFAADPIGEVEHIYQHYGLPLSASAKSTIRAWYEDPKHRGDRHGKFEYSLQSFGVDADSLEERIRGYRKRFSIPRESH